MTPLDIASLRAAYRGGSLTPEVLIASLYRRMEEQPVEGMWIHRVPLQEALAAARELKLRARPEDLPLYGIPFSVKDNMDVAGMPTTAGCEDYRYTAEKSAPVVDAMLRAGAICLGKVNLDQFGMGLSGTRSPFGACRNVFDPKYLAGGSSSGSALSVAAHCVSFSLATDTEGEARVPAALNNVVALKPSRWLLSTDGIASPCAGFEGVAILAGNVNDAAAVRNVASGYGGLSSPIPRGFRYAVPTDLEFFGDNESRVLFERCVSHLHLLGGTRVPVDFEPFLHLGEPLYELAVIARYLSVGPFLEKAPKQVLPLTRQLIMEGRSYTVGDAFRLFTQGDELRRRCLQLLNDVAFLITPTVPTHFRAAQEASEPVRTATKLGLYTRFAAFLESPVLSVPAGFRRDGLPFGVSLIGHARADLSLDPFGDAIHDFSKAGTGRVGLGVQPRTSGAA